MRSRYRWVVLGLATLMQLGVSLPQQTPAALGPVLSPALHLSRAQLGLLTDAIWGGMLFGMLPFGLFVDRLGERRMIGAGGLALAALFVVASFATGFWPLFLLLLPAAVAASAGAPGGARALAGWFPPWQRGMAMGVRQTGVTLAGVVAAVALPQIALRADWRASFRAVAVAIVLAVGLFVLFYREPPRENGRRIVAFRLRGLLQERTWLAATAFGWVFMGTLGCSVTYVATSLHQDAGLSVLDAGLVLGVLQVGGIAGRAGWGIWSDRLRSRGRVMFQVGVIAVGSCLAMGAFGHGRPPLLLLLLLAFTLGISAMGWNALYITLSSEVTPERAATVVGAGSTVTFTGMLLVTPVFGAIADRSGSYMLAWFALAGWSVLGTLAALFVADRTIGGADRDDASYAR